MRYLHTMIRVGDLDAALDFFVSKLGMVETRRMESEKGRFTLVFLAAPDDAARAAETAAPRGRADLQLGPGRPIRAAAISAISPMRSTTSTRFATGWPRRA